MAIKERRLEKGWSRKDLQAATELSYPYLSEIESGKKMPSTQVLRRIGEALGVEAHALLEAAERGREPRGWIAPRKSHFHESVAASMSPPDASFDLMAAPPPMDAEMEDPVSELLHLIAALPEEEIVLLLQLARRLAR